jgi:hypothetical protein
LLSRGRGIIRLRRAGCGHGKKFVEFVEIVVQVGSLRRPLSPSGVPEHHFGP